MTQPRVYADSVSFFLSVCFYFILFLFNSKNIIAYTITIASIRSKLNNVVKKNLSEIGRKIERSVLYVQNEKENKNLSI